MLTARKLTPATQALMLRPARKKVFAGVGLALKKEAEPEDRGEVDHDHQGVEPIKPYEAYYGQKRENQAGLLE